MIWIPDHLTAEQEHLYGQLREIEEPAPEQLEDRKGFWSRMKEALGGE